MNFACLYNKNFEKYFHKKIFSKILFVRKPLDCALTKSVKTIYK